MNTHRSFTKNPATVIGTLWLASSLLAACGGNSESFAAEVAPRSTGHATVAMAAAATTPIPAAAGVAAASTAAPRPLLAADGRVLPADPLAVPADAGARTRRQHYASSAQFRMLDRALRGEVIDVEVGCCGTEAADMAVLTAYGMQAAMNLPDSAPFFVRGSDMRLAATVADRLAEAGMQRVFLVTR